MFIPILYYAFYLIIALQILCFSANKKQFQSTNFISKHMITTTHEIL